MHKEVDLSMRFVRRSLVLIYIIFVVLFFASAAVTIDFDRIRSVNLNVSMLWLSFSLIFAFRFVQSYFWMNSLRWLGENNKNYSRMNMIFSISWMSRYIPGKFAAIVSRVYLSHIEGVDAKKVSVGTIVESLTQVCATFFVGGVSLLLLFDGGEYIEVIIFVVVSITLLLVVLSPYFLKRVVLFFCRVLLRDGETYDLGYNNKILIRYLGFFFVAAFIGGLYFWLIIEAICGQGVVPFLLSLGVYSISGAVGMLAFFFPSGLGVREFVSYSLLLGKVPAEPLVIVLILSRVIGLFSDILYFLSSLLIYHLFHGCLNGGRHE